MPTVQSGSIQQLRPRVGGRWGEVQPCTLFLCPSPLSHPSLAHPHPRSSQIPPEPQNLEEAWAGGCIWRQ